MGCVPRRRALVDGSFDRVGLVMGVGVEGYDVVVDEVVI